MKFESPSSRAAALVALIAGAEAAQHGHHHHHQHHHEIRSVPEVGSTLVKKSGQCQFPADAGLVAITPTEQNAGWAMSPNQPCTPGSYCPYACPAGQVSMQWDPQATSYTYPLSMVRYPDLKSCEEGGISDVNYRTVVSSATMTERSRSPSPIDHTARMAAVRCRSSTRLAPRYLSARPCFLETRPC